MDILQTPISKSISENEEFEYLKKKIAKIFLQGLIAFVHFGLQSIGDDWIFLGSVF